MSYIITSTTGATIATIAEGTINTSVTSLTLVGKNYTGYGALINENFVKLLENFSHVVSPPTPVTGQLWYDSNEHVLKVYTTNYGGVWKPISSSATGAVAPVGPVTGDLWWDTATTQLKVYSGSTWVTIGPTYTATAGTSGAIVETIIDSTTASHVVVKTYISNAAISILSKDAEFTPQTPIPGFTTIKPGLNLISSGTVAGVQFTGNVTNSYLFNGLTDTQFLRSDVPITTSAMLTAGGGVTVGANLVIADTAGTISLTNGSLNNDLNIYVNKAGVTTQAINVNGTTGAITFGGAVVMSTASASTLTSTTINNTTFNGGTVNATGVIATNLTGTLQTAAQPNVTSVGALSSLTMAGPLTLSANASSAMHAVTKQQLDAFAPADASETVKGIAEIATQAEVNTGTDDVRFVTALKLKNATSLSSIGVGQTWQNVIGSRASGVTYTNTTGKPIMVSTSHTSVNGWIDHYAIVNGVRLSSDYSPSPTSTVGGGTHSFIVPNGATYSVTFVVCGPAYWVELR